ncbi:MAG: hypothetical protein K9K66_14180 [Desulfarculaceae bacterium]|nr:hypothetical protein [Desulfarculaceae bacterium]MCF8073820.1 hypothetical protein [Desulfarculaceae bacterium]MCF8102800.1 hypothetical protein [Desulfarculaceae bacterium]MCF8116244.1 hypothetical protein [Desulfarculaceae bacterium]
MNKLDNLSKASAGKTKISKQDGKWLASDPASLESVLTAIEKANSWSQGKNALVAIFSALLKN